MEIPARMSHDISSQNGTLRAPGTTSSSLLREIDNDRRSTLRDVRYGTMSTYISEHERGTVFIRVSVPELKVQKCLQFELDETVWDAKQRILTIFAKDLKDALNYGLYMPPMNGRAGKFLDEERMLREYPLHGPIGFLEFKYKRRVYKVIHLNPRKLKQFHNKTNFRQFIEHVKNGNLSKINKFTNKGLDPNFHDSSGETPLCHAVSLPKDKCREIIITLVSGGGHIDFRNRHGQTPMHKAVIHGNQMAVKTLLDLGASTNYKDAGGLTPLYYSVLYGKNGSCAEMLLHERAYIGVRDEQGWYEIHQACKLGLIQHLEHLMFFGADLDVTNASGNTALHICAINNNEQCARILLFRGADKHVLNYNNQTPQQVAIIAGNIALAEMIKEFDENQVVPFREIPKFSERRPRLSMYASTLSLTSRSRSDPKLNITSAIDDSNITSPPSSMRSLPQHYNNMYSDSGSYSASRESDSPRSMSISSNSSGPVMSVSDTGYWEGAVNDRNGWFPAHHVQEVYLRNKAGSCDDILGQESRENTLLYRNTLATLVRSDNIDYGARTVVLQRAKEGYGFVLRGAKSQLKPSGELDFRPTAEFPALQYLDSVDPGSVSDRAGLKGGDFILEINGENVVRASHDRVVHLIRSTGDTLAMKVVTVKSPNMSPDWFVSQDKSMTMPNRKKKAAPMPPQRDPRTSLSMSRSEGYAVSEEMAAMEKLDDAILGHQESEEKKTASIRNRTAAKRVSCVDMENIGVDGRLERSKSTPDLLDNKAKTTIYATPTVPDKKSNVYAVPGVNATSTGSPTGVQMRPKNAPPPPPPEGSPKKQKQAPRPPGSDSGESSSSEFVSIKMKKESPYASSKIYVAQPNKRDSQYESSFRPGDSAKLSEEPKETGNYKPGTPKQSPGGVTVRVGDNNSDKQNVSFAEDKVIDHAASFLKKHPNAKLLITADGQASMRKRTSKMIDPESFENEPAPDYDSDSGEDKPRSPVKMRDAFRQSVTVISVGDRKQASPATKRYTVHSSIPSEEKQASGFVIPPRPSGPAPAPPANNQKKSAPMPPSQSPKLITVRAEVNNQPPQFDEVEAPPLPQTPPPDFEVNQTKTVPPAAPPLPPSTAPPPAPPPPPPPPPAPSVSDVIKTKSSAKADYIAPVPVPTDAIAAAVLKRQERMKTDGPLMSQQKTNQSPTTPPVDSNQAAILAAVARRRQQLEKQSDTDVIDSIESKLQKTKKLQAAKFQIAGSKSVKRDTDSKSNDQSKSASNNKPSITVQSSSVKPATSVAPAKTLAKPVKAENTTKATELSFKVKPVTVTKPQTDNKAKYAPYPLTSNTNSNKPSTVTSAKVNETRKFKPEPIVKSETNTLNSQSNNGVKTGESPKPENTNGQSDYLALAEKKRQEWLQRKQKSSESKSSSTSGTPEKTRPQVSPPVSAKPSKKVINGDTKNYTNVPPPPPGFRDGGLNETTVQLEIIPPPMNFTADNGTKQHSPAFSPDTASLVSSLSTLSSLSGDHNDGPGNGFDDIIAPPPPGFDDSESSVIPPPPEFGNDNNGNVQKFTKSFNDKPINQWLCNDVLDWLDSLNLSQYKSSFQTNCIDGKKLVSLSRNNYIDLGVTTVGHRMNLERSIKKATAKTQTSKDIIASEHL